MSTVPVLHLSASYEQLDRFILNNAFLGAGQALSVHLNDGHGAVIIYDYRSTPDGKTGLSVSVTTHSQGGCGCP
jgi:hypothetical protein